MHAVCVSRHRTCRLIFRTHQRAFSFRQFSRHWISSHRFSSKYVHFPSPRVNYWHSTHSVRIQLTFPKVRTLKFCCACSNTLQKHYLCTVSSSSSSQFLLRACTSIFGMLTGIYTAPTALCLFLCRKCHVRVLPRDVCFSASFVGYHICSEDHTVRDALYPCIRWKTMVRSVYAEPMSMGMRGTAWAGGVWKSWNPLLMSQQRK